MKPDDFKSLARRLASRRTDNDLFGTAGALVVGSGSAAFLGFVYWLIAARGLPAEVVGMASALISLLGLVGAFGDFGLGALLLGDSENSDRRGLIWAALWTSILVGAGAALITVFALNAAGVSLAAELRSWPSELFFIASAGLTSFCLVLDQALIGLLDGRRQMYRNFWFSLVKLVLLLAAILMARSYVDAMAIVVTWMLAKLIVTLVFLRTQPMIGGDNWRAPDFQALNKKSSQAFGHHALNIAAQMSPLLMPVVVTVLIGAAENAAFYAAWMLLQVVVLVPSSLTTVLYTVGMRNKQSVGHRARTTMLLSLAFSVAAIFGFFILGSFAVSLFKPDYAVVMKGSVQVLGLGMLGITAKLFYVAAIRIGGIQWTGARVLALGVILELGGAALGAGKAGLWGLVLGWLVGQTLAAVLMLPEISRMLRA